MGVLLLYGLVAIAPTLLCWLLLRLPRLIRLVRQRFFPPPPVPAHPPVQVLAADLRRVHRLLAAYGPGTPAARRTGTRQAYDALLAEACAVLEVPHRLDALPEGMDREIERLRVEDALREAGLTIP
ncbi:hypothetical protein [Amycolatopsis albispora]|uniref:Uncharacterized protein n=1 Tax=Amycolatopsis albispora TaxID=1804986 RepID=A0A344L660_9PSEU|nr:hypothetical protein [Amycolatopsis albispora]AXB43534.1 hypothetical protein A4R43_14090 [Amycolatopsis albispora]